MIYFSIIPTFLTWFDRFTVMKVAFPYLQVDPCPWIVDDRKCWGPVMHTITRQSRGKWSPRSWCTGPCHNVMPHGLEDCSLTCTPVPRFSGMMKGCNGHMLSWRSAPWGHEPPTHSALQSPPPRISPPDEIWLFLLCPAFPGIMMASRSNEPAIGSQRPLTASGGFLSLWLQLPCHSKFIVPDWRSISFNIIDK